MANSGPSMVQVTRMESTPVCGVDNRKAVVAARLAPCCRNEAATGITPQEHKGRGTPNRDAFSTGPIPRPPRWRSNQAGEMNTDNRPATTKPSNSQADIRAVTSQVSIMMCVIISIMTTKYRERW